ncbi:MAG: GDSL-type esterase/lipase family protein, partial [bacterium]|nr:GDSL-type esterase/lipase family protein [bacterium]
MASNQNERMREIRKRKNEREKKRKKIMGIIFGAAALLIVVIAAVSIASCGKQKENNPEVNVMTTAAPHPTENPKGSREIDQTFYKDSCFVGGTFIADLSEYEFVENADYVYRDGASVSGAMKLDSESETKAMVEELNNNSTYKKIFLSFGEAELGDSDTEEFIDNYKSLISKIKKYQPDAKLFIMAVTPVTEEKNDENEGGYTNKNVEAMNGLLKQIAKDTSAVYCDLFEAVANSKDVLPEAAAEDGIHLERAYCEKALVYVQKNYTDEKLKNGTDTSDDTDETSSTDESSSSSGS